MAKNKPADSPLVAHARRELEMAKLFEKNEKEDYDGFIGRGTLALVKLFDDWTKGDHARQDAVGQVFNFIINGEILSPPTDDPDEWEEFSIEGNTGLSNKRNKFYISRDNLKTWYNLRTGQKGVIINHLTGEPLEGVTIDETEEGSADAGDSRDGGNIGDAIAAGETGRPEVEEGELDPGVEPKSQEGPSQAEAGTEESTSREK